MTEQRKNIAINPNGLVNNQYLKYISATNELTGSMIDLSITGSLLLTESFNSFTQSYYVDSQSFDNRINLISNFIDITYNELTSSILNGTLEKGQNYSLTDFQTIYLMPNTGEIHSGSIEPLFLTAIETTSISHIAYSKLFPQDIIYYDWIDNSCEDGVYNEVSHYYEGGTFRHGRITYRKDINRLLSTPYDWRSVKFRRWKFTASIWDTDTEYSNGDIAEYNDGIYKYLETVSGSDYEPGINTITSMLLYDFSSTTYFPNRYIAITSSYYAQLTLPGYVQNGGYIDSEDYQDYYTFTFETDLNNNLGYDTSSGRGFYNCNINGVASSNNLYGNNVIMFRPEFDNSDIVNLNLINTFNNTLFLLEYNKNISINNGNKNIICNSDNINLDTTLCDLNLVIQSQYIYGKNNFRYNYIMGENLQFTNNTENNTIYYASGLKSYYTFINNKILANLTNVNFYDETTSNTFYNIENCSFNKESLYNYLICYIYNCNFNGVFQGNTTPKKLYWNNETIESCNFDNFITNHFTSDNIYISYEIYNNRFYSNTMSCDISSYNNIQSIVTNNQFTGNLTHNKINDNFLYNTCSIFQYNTINTQVTSSDFTSATHVQNEYMTEVFSRSGSLIPRLKYYDLNDVLHFTDVTA